MPTVKIKISPKIFSKVLDFLRTFKKEELEFIVDDEFYAENKAYLNEELNEVQEGKATYLTLKELEDELTKVIKKNEDRL
jgi:hypothetical protein